MPSNSRPVALVTGAAGGIGLAIAERLAADGFDLGITAEVPLDAAEQAAAAAGRKTASVVADFTEPQQAAAVVEQVVSELGRLDVLVNNAGLTKAAPIEEATPDDFDLMMSINLKAGWHAIRAAVPHMRRLGGGSIVNISSIHGSFGRPGHAIYAATKGGVNAATRALAVELARDRIRVNAIAPGVIEVARYHDWPGYSSEVGAGWVPWPRAGTPEDVAGLVSYLASPGAEFVTGQTIGIDGGTSALLALLRTELHGDD